MSGQAGRIHALISTLYTLQAIPLVVIGGKQTFLEEDPSHP